MLLGAVPTDVDNDDDEAEVGSVVRRLLSLRVESLGPDELGASLEFPPPPPSMPASLRLRVRGVVGRGGLSSAASFS